jgi:hypothetical protein
MLQDVSTQARPAAQVQMTFGPFVTNDTINGLSRL